jgi:hypothetical protein
MAPAYLDSDILSFAEEYFLDLPAFLYQIFVDAVRKYIESPEL